MEDTVRRPFYHQFAWAYDHLITPPIAQHCDFIVEKLRERGVSAGSRILDAGCGTGRYALELARRGFVVRGIDASVELIDQAQARARDSAFDVSFSVGNILDLSRALKYDAILCRGVLNDLLDEAQRRQVFLPFVGVLRSAGTLILDVRDWESSAERKSRTPVVEQTVETPRGTLTFRNETKLDVSARQLVVLERHTLRSAKGSDDATYVFRMQCWTVEELTRFLGDAGFGSIELFGAYDVTVSPDSSDRIVCVASVVR